MKTMKSVTHNIDQARVLFKKIDWTTPKDITIKEYKAKKSPQQKGLFYAWIREITQHLQDASVKITENQVKELIKQEFGPKIEMLGYKFQVSTEDYDWDSMSDVLMEIKVWAVTDLNLELKVKKGILHEA